MSLSISLLGPDGTPEEDVDVYGSLYEDLMSLSQRCNLRLLLRMTDYYEDVDFAPHEIAQLVDELRIVHKQQVSAALSAWIEALIRLSEKALERGQGLSAIAD